MLLRLIGLEKKVSSTISIVLQRFTGTLGITSARGIVDSKNIVFKVLKPRCDDRVGKCLLSEFVCSHRTWNIRLNSTALLCYDENEIR